MKFNFLSFIRFLLSFLVIFFLVYFTFLLFEWRKEQQTGVDPFASYVRFAQDQKDKSGYAEGIERSVLQNPDDSELRKKALAVHFLLMFDDKHGSSREKGLNHVNWFIEKHPEDMLSWSLLASFSIPDSEENFKLLSQKQTLLWESSFNSCADRLRCLRNAAEFLDIVNLKRSTELWKEISESDPLDTLALERYAASLSNPRLGDQDRTEHLKESFEIYLRRLELPWSNDDYYIISALREKHGSILFPHFMKRWVLWVKGNQAILCGCQHDVRLLTDAGRTGFEAGLYDQVEPLILQINNLTTPCERDDEKIERFESTFKLLARWHNHFKNKEGLEFYLKTLLKIPKDQFPDFIYADKDLIREIHEGPFNDLAIGYLKTRLTAFDPKSQSQVKSKIKEIVGISL